MDSDSIQLEARIERERAAHEEDDVLARNQEIKNRFPHATSYPSLRRLSEHLFQTIRESGGGRILDYGCGRGDLSLQYVDWGFDVVGIDIAANYIEDAKRRAAEAGLGSERADFRVMDAHALEFPDESFDAVVGFGILHHLDPDIAMAEIHRVLKPGGRVLLQEPLLDNPLLKVFRTLTPKARTVDELPFSGKALRALSEARDWEVRTVYSGIIALPVAMITSVVLKNRQDNFLTSAADRLERWFHRQHVLDSWNQYVLIHFVKGGPTG